MGRLLVSRGSIIRKYGYVYFVICTCAFSCVYLLSVEIKEGEKEEEEEWKVDQRILIKDLTR